MNMRLSALVRTPTLLLAILGLVAGIAISLASFAHADAGPTVGLNVRNTSNAVVTTAPIGSVLYASTTVASSTASTTPTGTVTFNMFANLTCSGTATTQAGVALASSTAMSSTTTMPATGLSYTVHYSGDAANASADSQCVAVTPTSAGTQISTTLSTSSVLAGSSVLDMATLGSVTSNASGTVKYTIYTNNSCTAGAVSAGTVSVANAIVPNSTSMQFNTPGTYYWQVVYSGDTQNVAATSTCGAEVLTVLATTTPVVPPPVPVPVPPTPGTGSITGVVFNDLNRNHKLDAGEPGIAGFVIKLHNGKKNKSPIIATTTTDTNGAYSFTNLAFGTYYVEEVNMTGWKQTTPDSKERLSSTTPTRVLNFASIVKVTPVKKGHENEHGILNAVNNVVSHVTGHDSDDDKGDKGNGHGKGNGKKDH